MSLKNMKKSKWCKTSFDEFIQLQLFTEHELFHSKNTTIVNLFAVLSDADEGCETYI